MTSPRSIAPKRDIRLREIRERGIVVGAPHTVPDAELFARPYVKRLMRELAHRPDVALAGESRTCPVCRQPWTPPDTHARLYCSTACSAEAKRVGERVKREARRDRNKCG